MATVAEVNAQLGTTGMNAQIVIEANRTNSGATVLTKDCYCVGGVDVPGKAGWVVLTVADDAATQAAAVLAGLA